MSADVERAVKVGPGLEDPLKRSKDPVHRRPMNLPSALQNKKHKSEESRHFRFCRKRSQSFSGSKVFPLHKKRKKEKLMPPTKFLLGGNIHDPLNLNSLQDEEINRAMNAVTPKSSPMPTPKHLKGEVEVIIPPNIRDPLNLAGSEEDEEYEARLTNPGHKKFKKKHKKKKQRSSTGSGKEDNSEIKSDESKTEEILEQEMAVDICPKVQAAPNPESEEERKEVTKPNHLDLPFGQHKDFKKPKKDEKEAGGVLRESARKFELKDKIVSPVIPQPGTYPNRHQGHRFRKKPQRPNQPTPKFKEQNKRYQFGNYNRYYGYRNPNNDCDARLKLFAGQPHLFAGKDVLDIGCNNGFVTLSIARDFGARTVVGVDIDRSLIDAARASIRKFASTESKGFPKSMSLLYGTLDVPGVSTGNAFPHNVSFVQGNYLVENDVLLSLEQPQFDVILCLSVTKWFHLNWGDAGLKRAFARMYAQLRPGGILILEPQAWSSYKRKKNLTESLWRNYKSIKFFPAMFTEFLLSEVGFSKCEVLGSPNHPSKGFQRTIKVFTKGETPLSSRTPAADSTVESSKDTDGSGLDSMDVVDPPEGQTGDNACSEEVKGDCEVPRESPMPASERTESPPCPDPPPES